MKKNYLIPLFLSMLALFAGCSSPGNDGSQAKRNLQIPSPSPAPTVETQPTLPILNPGLLIDQEIENCTDNPKCHLETNNEAYSNDNSPYRINSVIFADSDLMTGINTQEAPIIKFSLKEIDPASVTSSTMTYIKKDSLGAVLVQTSETQITGVTGSYTVPIHSSTLGSGILISAPYEKHTLLIKLVTNSGQNHSFEIDFFLSSNTTNPVIIERDPLITDSSYYKANEDLQSFLIDAITLENTIPFTVSLNGDINLNNTTIAFLSETSATQHKTFIPETPGYHFDTYNWFTTANTTYNLSTAFATYTIKTVKDGVEEEVPATISYNGLETLLSVSGLEIAGSQKIKLNIYANVDINNSILGNHGQQTFFVGKSLCSSMSVNASCNCFFTPKNINDSSANGTWFYNIAAINLLTIQNLYYPSCGSSVPSGSLTQQISIVNYPANAVSLIGRHHKTEAKYTITTWLKGYENYDDLGTTSRTMDTLDITKGFVDYTQVNTAMGYQGYIPGQI